MSYIGNVPTTAAFPFDQFSGTGSQVAFTLSQAPASTTSIAVTVSGVTQNPNTYSVSGTTLTFTGAPPSGTNNIGVLFLGLPTLVGVPSAATVGLTQLSATGTPSSSTFLRGDNTWNAPAAAITSGTAVASTSGTSIDFTGIPSTAKRITVMLRSISTTGSSNYLIRIGNTTFTVTGYTSVVNYVNIGANSCTGDTDTTGFRLTKDTTAAWSFSAVATIVQQTSGFYICTFTGMNAGGPGYFGTGILNLGSDLDRVRITTVNGTDTFDAGTINILWE